jgi:hypothetical protein
MSRSKENNLNLDEKLEKQALDKYRELYTYSTDILLKELERFNRADEKAAKLSATFIFLLGVAAYFDKWFFNKLQWPDFPIELPSDKPLLMASLVGLLALILSAIGFFLSCSVIMTRPVVSRPLDQAVLDFFENQTLLNIYYGFARENGNAYEKNKKATDRKYTFLKWSHLLMRLAFISLAELFVMFCLYSWT